MGLAPRRCTMAGSWPIFRGTTSIRLVTLNYRLGVFGFLASEEIRSYNKPMGRRVSATMDSGIRSRHSGGSTNTSAHSG
jgi:hypothetical protein